MERRQRPRHCTHTETVAEMLNGHEALQAKAATFNHLIDRTIEELSMSEVEFDKILSNLVALRAAGGFDKASLTDTYDAVRMILASSRDYLSIGQATQLAEAFSPNDVGSGDMYVDWGCFGDWMHGLALEGGACNFARKRLTNKPPADVIGHPAYPHIYHGLEWNKAYTYVEARPIIAKALIGRLGKTTNGYNVGDTVAVRHAASTAIVFDLQKRAWIRSTALRCWGRLIKLAPLVGRLSLAFKQWYLEISLQPGRGSVFEACRERFVEMQ